MFLLPLTNTFFTIKIHNEIDNLASENREPGQWIQKSQRTGLFWIKTNRTFDFFPIFFTIFMELCDLFCTSLPEKFNDFVKLKIGKFCSLIKKNIGYRLSAWTSRVPRPPPPSRRPPDLKSRSEGSFWGQNLSSPETTI